jgi:predicted enzyme related to lactoylglutathione lyase
VLSVVLASLPGMVIRSSPWPAGTPCWVDVAVSDVARAADFYAGLFGWRVTPDDSGYAMCALDGHAVAGIGSGRRATWTTYLAADDVTATVAAAVAEGATVLAAPFDVRDAGRMAVLADPFGAVVGVWQAGTRVGAAVANEVGALVWNELRCADLPAAKAFYAAAFGHAHDDLPAGAYVSEYAMVTVDGTTVGGLCAADGPAHWMTYFEVVSTDASVRLVADLGGAVVSPPADTAYGRIAVVSDDQGAVFSLIQG